MLCRLRSNRISGYSAHFIGDTDVSQNLDHSTIDSCDSLILDTIFPAMIDTHVLLTRRKTHMYAIIETGGKQYRVEAGTVLQVESLPGDVGHSVQIDRVRLLNGDGGLVVGQPIIPGARVTAEIIRQGRTRSITVFKKHRRKNYRRTRGHRQGFTQLRVTEIETK